MKKDKIAIIVLNWRQSDLTINCVKSLLVNNYENYRIFLVDNHSQDGSEEKFKEEFGNNPMVKILQTYDNLGYAGGNNWAIKTLGENSFDYICILNNDTLVDRNLIKALLTAAARFGEKNIYFPLIFYWESDIIQSGGLRDYLPTPFQFKYKREKNRKLAIEESPLLSGCCFLAKLDVFRRLGGFREDFFMYGEDIEFSIRAKKLGVRFFLVPQAKIWHKGAIVFTPSSAYYAVRNSLHLISELMDNKFYEYTRCVFWFSLLILVNIFRLRVKTAVGFIRGGMLF